MGMFGTIKTTCEICGGKRFKEEVLTYKLGDKSIADVLEMTVEQALSFFISKRLCASCRP